MFFPTLVISSVLGLVAAVPINYQASFEETLRITTPGTFHQCTPATISWTPTTGPYHLTITSKSNGNGLHPESPISEEEEVVVPHSSSASWIVDTEEGSLVTVVVRDSTGQVAQSITRTVLSGPEHCL